MSASVTRRTSQFVAAVGTVGVAVAHPGVDDAGPGAAVKTVWCTGRGTRGHRVRGDPT